MSAPGYVPGYNRFTSLPCPCSAGRFVRHEVESDGSAVCTRCCAINRSANILTTEAPSHADARPARQNGGGVTWLRIVGTVR